MQHLPDTKLGETRFTVVSNLIYPFNRLVWLSILLYIVLVYTYILIFRLFVVTVPNITLSRLSLYLYNLSTAGLSSGTPSL